MLILVLQRICLDALIDVVYFPIWWYTGGIKFMVSKCLDIIKGGNESLAPGLWLKNIFVPMFGQWDFQGRLISFFMRLVQVVARSIALLVWIAFAWGLFLFWLVLPIIITRGLIGVIN